LSQKLESVGRLAAGVAHEINTPMQYIGDNVFFIRESFETLSDLLANQKDLLEQSSDRRGTEIADDFRALETRLEIEDILQAAPGALNRAQGGIETVNRIVAAMKELAHPGEGAKASTDINALIETAVTITRNAHKTVAEIEKDLGDIPNALTYKNELCQVFINLIVNAAHAIETARESGPVAGRIVVRTRQENGSILICISDNGCGIPPAALEKVFDPFFTTKAVGKGTGQGLALARTAIIDKHGGEIDVDSAVGSGTTFKITLPLEAHEPPAST
jgi:signal transduction histidine kinase